MFSTLRSARSLSTKTLIAAVLTFSSTLVVASDNAATPDGKKSPISVSVSSKTANAKPISKVKAATDLMGHTPLAFEANSGQFDPRVQYVSRGAGYALFLTRDEAVLSLLNGKGQPDVLRIKLTGSDAKSKVSAIERLPWNNNYFIGKDPKKWRTNVPNYRKVQFENVYPGVELVYYGNQRQLEHDFVVAPGADPKQIAMEIAGAKDLSIDANGNLVISTPRGEVRFEKPVIYQDVNGTRKDVAGKFTLRGKKNVGFEVAAYDKSKELIIDPVINFGTLLSASVITSASSVALDGSNNAYVAGITAATAFPAPAPAPNAFGPGGSDDIFVVKVSADGSSLGFVTFIGSSGQDAEPVNPTVSIALDGSNNAFLTGKAFCTAVGSTNFPTTTDAFQQSSVCPGGSSAFMTAISSNGNALVYSTLYGGDADTTGGGFSVRGISVLGQEAFIVGLTTNTGVTPLPTSPNAFQSTPAAGTTGNGFLAQFNTAQSVIATATCDGAGTDTVDFGGAHNFVVGEQVIVSNVVANGGNVGTTVWNTAPGSHSTITAVGATSISYAEATCNDAGDTGTGGTTTGGLVYGTYLGGTTAGGSSAATAVVALALNNVYVAGTTNTLDFPTVGAAQATNAGGVDGFISAFDPTNPTAANTLTASTYFGGSNDESLEAIAFDGGSGTIFATGRTLSTNIPNTAGGAQVANGGLTDVYITNLSGDLATINQSTYLGGSGDDIPYNIVLDPSGNFVWVVGQTNTPTVDNIFHVNAIDPVLAGPQDGFIAKVTTALTAVDVATYFGGNGTDRVTGLAAVANDQIVVTGDSDSTDLYALGGTTGSAYQTVPASANVAGFAAKLAMNSTAITPNFFSVAPTNSVDPLLFDASNSSDYTITLTNNDGAVDAHNVTLDLHSDLGKLLVNTVTPTGMTCVTGQANANSGITCDVGTITSAGGTASVVVNVSAVSCAGTCPATSAATGIFVSAAEAGSYDNSQSITSNILPVADIQVSAVSAASDVSGANKFVVQKDSTFTYSYTVANNGPNTSGTFDITNTLPAGFTANTVNINVTTGTATSATCDAQAGTLVTCHVNGLSTPGVITLSLVGDPTALLSANVASTTNQLDFSTAVTITGNTYVDTTPGNDTGSNTGSTLERDISLSIPTLTATPNINNTPGSPFVVQQDSTIAYALTVKNAGPSTATNVVLTVNFPAGSVLNGGQPGACGGGSGFVGGTGLETCVIGNLTVAAGAVPVAFSITPPALNPNTPSTVLGVSAALSTSPNSANDTGTDTNSVNTTQERVATFATSAVPSAAGTDIAEQQVGTVSYTVKGHNNGPSDVTNMRVQIKLDTGVASNFTSLLGNDGAAGCAAAVGQIVTCTSANPIAAGADYSITFTATAPATINGNAAPATQTFLATNLVTVDTNPASVFSTIGGAAQVPVNTNYSSTVERRSDLSVGALTATAGPTALSGAISLDLTAGSSNTNYAIPGVTVVYTLTPTGPAVSFASGGAVQGGSTTGATCLNTVPAPAAALTITCTITNLANAGQPIHLVISTPTTDNVNVGTVSTAAFTSHACISGSVTAASDPGSGCGAGSNNLSTTAGADPSSTIQRQADLDITTVAFAGSPNPVSLAGPLTYTYRVRNNGPDTALNVLSTITETSTAVTTPLVVGAFSGANSCVRNVNNVDCTVNSIGSGVSTLITVPITPPVLTSMTGLTAVATDTLSGVASLGVQVSTTDTTGANNTNATTVNTTLQRTSDVNISGQPVSLTRSAAVLANTPGVATGTTVTTNLTSPMSLQFALTNAGPDAALNSKVLLTNVTPAIATPISGISSTAGSTCTLAAGNIQCSVDNVPTVGTTTITVNFTPPTPNSMTLAGGAGVTSSYTTTAALNAQPSYVDPGAGNNSNATTLTTNLARQSDLQLTFGGATFTATPSPVDLTGTITYAYNYKNAGPDPALKLASRITLTTAGIHTPFVFQTAGSTVDIGGGPVPLAGAATNGCVVSSSTTLDCEVDGPIPVGVGNGFVLKVTPPLTTNMFNGASTDAVFNNLAASSVAVFDDGTAGAAGANNASPTSITTTIQRTADLNINSVTATSFTAAVTNLGASFVEQRDATIHFDFVVQNNGPNDSPATVLTVNVPAGSTLPVGLPGICGGGSGFAANTITCNLGTLTIAAGATPISFVVAPAPLGASTAFQGLSAQGTISGGVLDNVPAGNSQTALITQERDINLQIPTMVATPFTGAPAASGPNFVEGRDATIHYDVSIRNTGPSDGTNVVLTLGVPAGSTLPGGLPGACGGGSNFAGTTITCNVGNLTVAAGTQVITFVVTPPALSAAVPNTTLTTNAALGTNPISAINTGGAGSSNFVSTTQERDADLSATISVPVTTLDVGPGFDAVSNGHQQVTYTITAANAGPSDATHVIVTDVLPVGFTFNSFTSVLPGVNCTAAGTTVTCDFGAAILTNGASNNITITATATAASLPGALASNIVSNSASIASSTLTDPTPGNNATPAAAMVTLHGEADVSISSIVATPVLASPLKVGDDLVYAVTVHNVGPHPSQTNIAFTDVLPAGVVPVSAVGSGTTACVVGASTSCTLGSPLAIGGNEIISIRVHVPAAAAGALNYSAQVHSPANPVIDGEDSALGNNTNTNLTTALAAADLQLTQAASPNPTAVTLATTFTVTLTNPAPPAYTPGAPNPAIGGSNSTGISVRNVITVTPAAPVIQVTSITNNFGATCPATPISLAGGTATITCTGGTVNSGATKTVTLTTTPVKIGTVSNVATIIAANEFDPNAANNTTTVNDPVNNTPVCAGAGCTAIQPVDPVTGNPPLTLPQNLTVTFSNVTTQGSTTMLLTNQPATCQILDNPLLPAGTAFINNVTHQPYHGLVALGSSRSFACGTGTQPFFYDISTTAVATGSAGVCVNYTGLGFHKPDRVRLVRIINGVATDVTSPNGFSATTICGTLSTFTAATGTVRLAVMEPSNAIPDLSAATVTVIPSANRGGTGNVVDLTALGSIDIDGPDSCIGAAPTCVANSGSDSLTFRWFSNNFLTPGTVQGGAGGLVEVPVGSGNITIVLTATDPYGDSETRTFTVNAGSGGGGGGGGGGGTGFTTTATVNKGQAASFTTMLDNANGTVSGPVVIGNAATLLQSQITCTVTPNVLPANTTGNPVTVFCSTQGQIFAKMSAPRRDTGDAPMLAGMIGITALPLLGMLVMPGKSRRRRLLKMWAAIGLVMMFAMFQVACGGGSSSFGGAPTLQNAGTPTGTYQVILTPLPAGVTPSSAATTGTVAASTTFTLTVQ